MIGESRGRNGGGSATPPCPNYLGQNSLPRHPWWKFLGGGWWGLQPPLSLGIKNLTTSIYEEPVYHTKDRPFERFPHRSKHVDEILYTKAHFEQKKDQCNKKTIASPLEDLVGDVVVVQREVSCRAFPGNPDTPLRIKGYAMGTVELCLRGCICDKASKRAAPGGGGTRRTSF